MLQPIRSGLHQAGKQQVVRQPAALAVLSACGPPSCMLTMCCNLCILPLQTSGIVLTPAAQRATKMERRHSQKGSMQKRFRNELPKSDSQ